MLGTAAAYIAAAFFKVRISLAAAIAAGEAGLSGGAAGCCADAGRPASASPRTRPATDMNLTTLFILILLTLRLPPPELAASAPLDNANSLGAGEHGHAGQSNEQPVFDDPRNRSQPVR